MLIKFTLFILIVLIGGCTSSIIYVDKDNLAGPWDGTKTHPYKTIQDGLNVTTADSGDIVEVFDGVYLENVKVKAGTILRKARDETKTVAIIGKKNLPTISASDRSGIANFEVDGGNTGIFVEIKATPSNKKKPWTSIANCRILSKNAIWLKTPDSLDFGAGNRRTPKVYISNNWIQQGGYTAGTGIRFDLTGPKTGELSVYLDIVDNVIEHKFSGISLSAEGQGPNLGGFVRTQFTGIIENNLIIDGNTGIRLESRNLGSADLTVFNNTIANNKSHAIIASAVVGKDGGASTHPTVVNNIVSSNSGFGYLEFGEKTSAGTLSHNLFYQNAQGHYFDEQTGSSINSQKGLNTPIVGNKVIFYDGSGNLVVNPQFVKGKFFWNGTFWIPGKEASYFLQQSGSSKSPAVNGGLGSAKDAGLELKSTATSFNFDTGVVDIGFHYTIP